MKAVIFDFNGTLIFDGKYHDLAWKIMSEKIRGYAMSEEEINRNVHGKINEDIIFYLNPNLSLEENKRLSLEKEAMYRRLCLEDKENYTLVKGVVEYMEYLKTKSIPFTIASASIEENMKFFIEMFQLDKWIDSNLIVYNNNRHADKKSMFLAASKNLKVDIKDCIIFEDSFVGVECAKEIGAGMIVAIPSFIYKEEFDKNEAVSFTIADFTDSRIMEVL